MLEYEGCLPTSPDKIRSKKIYGKKSVPGIEINRKIKAIGCSNLKTLIENDRLVLVDDTTIQEMGTFVANNAGTYEADDGCHDDTISPLVLLGWLMLFTFFIFVRAFQAHFKSSFHDSGFLCFLFEV